MKRLNRLRQKKDEKLIFPLLIEEYSLETLKSSISVYFLSFYKKKNNI